MADSFPDRSNLEPRESDESTHDALRETRRLPSLILLQGDPAGGRSPSKGKERDKQLPTGVEHWLQDDQRIYPLKVGVNMLGRLPDNDVVIQEPHVSRRHCVIVVQAKVPCELHDNGSRNGTYVNGLRVSGSTRLFSGDEIWICRRRFVFGSKADRPG